MTSENEITEKTRQQLTNVRTVLLRLHKTLLDFERQAYERAHGTIGNSYQFLQLVMSDPWFAWLRQLSELIVEMDELLAAKETPSENTGVALIRAGDEYCSLRPSQAVSFRKILCGDAAIS